jgi:ABC-type phosphate transport system auxiliary subunit
VQTIESEAWTTRKKAIVGVILIAGILGVVSIWSSVSKMWETQPPAMPPEKFVETFKAADQVDRENWEKMWKEAGKKAPAVK